MERKTGDSAYPVISHGVVMSEGMSLRDYFAGQALAGMSGFIHTNESMAGASEHCYKIADAMLKERNRD